MIHINRELRASDLIEAIERLWALSAAKIRSIASIRSDARNSRLMWIMGVK